MSKNNAIPEMDSVNGQRELEEETGMAQSTLDDESTAAQTENEDQPKAGLEPKSVIQLERELQLAKQAKDEYYNRMLRIQADFDNFRRRSRQEYEQLCQYAGEDVVKKILPVIDNLERAVGCFKGSGDNGSWQDGVLLTLKQMLDILRAEGLEPVPALNVEFDPQVHEAIFQEESENVNVQTVIEELQKGYKFKNKLLRPALVKVAVPKLS